MINTYVDKLYKDFRALLFELIVESQKFHAGVKTRNF